MSRIKKFTLFEDAPPVQASDSTIQLPVNTLDILAKCDTCGRDILNNEVALMRSGIHCFDCCKKMWGMDD